MQAKFLNNYKTCKYIQQISSLSIKNGTNENIVINKKKLDWEFSWSNWFGPNSKGCLYSNFWPLTHVLCYGPRFFNLFSRRLQYWPFTKQIATSFSWILGSIIFAVIWKKKKKWKNAVFTIVKRISAAQFRITCIYNFFIWSFLLRTWIYMVWYVRKKSTNPSFIGVTLEVTEINQNWFCQLFQHLAIRKNKIFPIKGNDQNSAYDLHLVIWSSISYTRDALCKTNEEQKTYWKISIKDFNSPCSL